MSTRDYEDYVKTDELPALASELLAAGLPKWLVTLMLDMTSWAWPRLEGPLDGLSMRLIVDRAVWWPHHHEVAIKALGLPRRPNAEEDARRSNTVGRLDISGPLPAAPRCERRLVGGHVPTDHVVASPVVAHLPDGSSVALPVGTILCDGTCAHATRCLSCGTTERSASGSCDDGWHTS